MFTHISGDGHFWQSRPDQFIASNETTKQLYDFKSVDDCINWLFVNGLKTQARTLHAANKGK